MTDAYDSTKPSTWPFNLVVLEENSCSPIHKRAEYAAFTKASREAIWLCQLLLDINNRDSQPGLEPPLADPTIIYADNQGAFKYVKSEGIAA